MVGASVVTNVTVQSSIPSELVARIVIVPEPTAARCARDGTRVAVSKAMPLGRLPSTA